MVTGFDIIHKSSDALAWMVTWMAPEATGSDTHLVRRQVSLIFAKCQLLFSTRLDRIQGTDSIASCTI